MNRRHQLFVLLALIFLFATGCATPPDRGQMEKVRISPDGKRFVLEPSARPFTPWGFNYDHDERDRLIEDYWESDWPKVESDFREMKQLGANVVRVHLQFGRFMRSDREPDSHALARLGRLLVLAERQHLYLDITGLGCYHKPDVPAWYDALRETERWQAQAQFWEVVARQCTGSPAVFCYDLMNEPVVPGGDGPRTDWLGPPFAGKHFVQFITLDKTGRQPQEIARAWIDRLIAAIRRHDRQRLITVGLVPWSLDRPGLRSGFVPSRIAPALDFLSVHLYPARGKHDEDLETLRGFASGKPVLIEETFPLKCDMGEFSRFLEDSRPHAVGWLGFYWGRTPAECRASSDIRDGLMLRWLEFFQMHRGTMGGGSER